MEVAGARAPRSADLFLRAVPLQRVDPLLRVEPVDPLQRVEPFQLVGLVQGAHQSRRAESLELALAA